MSKKNNHELYPLFETLQMRKRPENVAKMILDILPSDVKKDPELKVLHDAASYANTYFSYMYENFHSVVSCKKQIKKAEEIFKIRKHLSDAECEDLSVVKKFIKNLNTKLGRAKGENNFSEDRYDRSGRKIVGLKKLSKRQYNKLWRHLVRLESKFEKYQREIKKNRFVKINHSGFATDLSFNEFKKNVNTAYFIAYYVSRCNLRSRFTCGSQDRPYDNVADALFKRCEKDPKTNWWAIAQVYSNKEVLDHLSENKKGKLLSKWFSTLQDIAKFLEEIWNKSDINKKTMIVKKGNDSDTWNNVAGAWNNVRKHWINLIYDLKMDAVLDEYCPGKVLRLMAADVAYWHNIKGDDLDENTLIWNDLPLPWEALKGKTECNRKIIKKVCANHKVDPVESGWIGPKSNKFVESFRPTPELVHGVAVGCPFLAKKIKAAGWFSGKKQKALLTGIQDPVIIQGDEHGFAISVDSSVAQW